MSTNPQPLSIIADVVVVVSSPQVAGPPFNQGLFIGSTPGVIPSYVADVNGPPRIRQYLAATYSKEMQDAGFQDDDPEFLCAQLYFSQAPAPQAVWIGVQDSTAIQTAIPSASNLGSGYVAGDIVSITQTGASFGKLRIKTVGALGSVTAVETVAGQQGTGYAIGTALVTTGGTGTGLKVDITAVGESPLDAVQACRLASGAWYCFMYANAQSSTDIKAVSAWVQSQIGTFYFQTTQDADSYNGVKPNLITDLFAANSRRTWMQWASTQGGLYPNQIYFTAAVMGCAMANNTQLAGSAYTMKFSAGVPLVGVYTEPLTYSQITNIEGLDTDSGPNCNLYINYANSYQILEQGTCSAAGQFFDEILNLDILASNIQYNILNVLTSVPKVPQTEPGQAQLEQAVEAALAQSAATGFIGSGVWNGKQVLKLTPGTALPLGYMVQSDRFANQSPADRQLRKAMPIYVCLIEAGAIHFVTIQVLVQR
jgi:hypothetical protein